MINSNSSPSPTTPSLNSRQDTHAPWFISYNTVAIFTLGCGVFPSMQCSSLTFLESSDHHDNPYTVYYMSIIDIIPSFILLYAIILFGLMTRRNIRKYKECQRNANVYCVCFKCNEKDSKKKAKTSYTGRRRECSIMDGWFDS